MKVRGFLGLLRPVGLLAVMILGLPPGVAGAQPVAAPAAAVIQPTTQLEFPPPKLRTWKEMEAAAALEAAGPPPPPRVKPFRPTMDAASYGNLKPRPPRIKPCEPRRRRRLPLPPRWRPPP